MEEISECMEISYDQYQELLESGYEPPPPETEPEPETKEPEPAPVPEEREVQEETPRAPVETLRVPVEPEEEESSDDPYMSSSTGFRYNSGPLEDEFILSHGLLKRLDDEKTFSFIFERDAPTKDFKEDVLYRIAYRLYSRSIIISQVLSEELIIQEEPETKEPETQEVAPVTREPETTEVQTREAHTEELETRNPLMMPLLILGSFTLVFIILMSILIYTKRKK